MIKHVVFFQPRTFASANYKTAAGDEQRWAPWFALVLAPLVQSAGMSRALIDARVDDGWAQQIDKLGPTDLLAVSVMTGHAIRDAVAASVTARARGARVVWGGPHITLFPQETVAQAPVDAVIAGYGYSPFAALLARLQVELWPTAVVPGVYFGSSRRDDGSQARRVDITAPDLSLISEWSPYVNDDVAIASRTVSAIGSEGCLRRCTFCSEPQTSGGTWLTRRESEIATTVADLLARSGANGVKFHDPNFFHDMSRSLRIADQISAGGAVAWAGTMYPEDLLRATDAALQALAHNGLRRLLIGLESPDARIVRLAGKQYDPVRIPEMARRLAAVGIRGMFTFIVGWPDADAGHYDRTIEAAFGIRRIWPEHQAKIHFLEPWPGTPMFTLLQRRGFVAPRTLQEWANNDYYLAQHSLIHDPRRAADVRAANQELSPYVDA